MMSAPLCPCGQPLHYRTAESRRFIEELIATKGECVKVTTPAGSWQVPRHYIGLHGLRAEELPSLAKRYAFRSVP